MAEFVAVAKVSEIAPGEVKQVELDDGTAVCLANVDGTFYAIGGECTHAGGPLGEGELESTTVTCPWHAGVFDVTTGEAQEAPPTDAVDKYEVQVDGDDVKVAIG